MKQVGKIAQDVARSVKVTDQSPTYSLGAHPAKIPVKKLGELSAKHLRGGQEKQFSTVLARAKEFVSTRKHSPGMSFVLTGSVGTGKTTIIQNLRQSAQIEFVVLDDDDSPLGDPFRTINSRFYSATDFMQLMDPGRRQGEGNIMIGRSPLYQLFSGVEMIAIDDVGTEELSFVSREMLEITRQNRYREAFDYFYDHRISILITSMVPLTRGGHPNTEFVKIFGPAAFDRLYERARGFMFDLTGLPSYRHLAGETHGR